MGLWTRIRQNLLLKIVSLVAAVLLYVYVQQERSPTISKPLLATVEYRSRKEGYQVVPAVQQVTVNVTGPRPVIDRMKDGDVKAAADVGGLTSNQPSSPVRVTYDLPKEFGDVQLDAPKQFVYVQVFRQKSRKFTVEAVWKHEAPPGLTYGEPSLRPSQVTVHGREDVVNRIDRVVAPASPVEPRANIEGDFSVVAWDTDHNVIEGLDIVPEKVHVTVPQVILPTEQGVLVQATLADRPAEPYAIERIVYAPNQVKVLGTPQRVAAIPAIYTETLSVHDLTATTTMEATLITPPDVQVRDPRGKPITRVKVTFVITRSRAVPGTDPGAAQKHDGAPRRDPAPTP